MAVDVRRERAVLVAVEFTGERRRLSLAARSAKRSAAAFETLDEILGSTPEEDGTAAEPFITDLDFDAGVG